MVGPEKKLLAPLIWAALMKAPVEVNELKLESVLMTETVIPGIVAAALLSESPVKSKLASVAACDEAKPNADMAAKAFGIDLIFIL